MIGKKDNYLNKDLNFIISTNIREYDIQSAGFNILLEKEVLNEKEEKLLCSMGKKQRNIQIGLMSKDKPELKKIISEGLIEYRQIFLDINNIKEGDILSIKRDAVFIITKPAKYTQLTKNIKFVMKNQYTSYYNLSDIEFYYNSKIVDIKGIGDKNLNKNMFLKLLFDIFTKAEQQSVHYMIDFIYDISVKYCDRDIDGRVYRELNHINKYKLSSTIYGKSVYIEDCDIYLKNDLDITYNYLKYILPLIRVFY